MTKQKNINNIKVLVYKDDTGFLAPACSKILPCDHELVMPVALTLTAQNSPCNTTIPQGKSFPAGSTEYTGLVQAYKLQIPGIGHYWVDKADYDSKIGECNGCCTPGACTIVTGLAAGSITTTGATISFTAPVGAAPAGYEWIVKTANVAPVIDGTYASASPIVLTGLTTGTTYYFFIKTICSATNKSAWTSVSFATT